MMIELFDAADRWPSNGRLELAVADARAAGAHLSKVVLLAAHVTLVDRLKEHLKELHVGEPLYFERDFADELPEASQREEVLLAARSTPAGARRHHRRRPRDRCGARRTERWCE